ncbi:MAG: phosphate ABC transporter permease PstA [Spirochaetaceae bacterium]|nr:phosphate ABC transporter permease PstA [Spirochaetaceae bacterium]
MSRVIRESVLSSGKDNINSEQLKGKLFLALCIAAILFGLLALSALLIYVFRDAVGWLNWQFITSPPSRFASKAGVYPMLIGSSFVIMLVAIFSLPLGVGAAVYLEEYAPKNFFKKIIETNIANLAGVPSIVYGLLGLGFFVSFMDMAHGTILVGALTLTLRILPVVIVSSQEAIRAVPDSQRRASYGLGTTRWQMIRSVVLPESMPGIMTGTILALAGAIGETAPLIMIGAATSIFTAPRGILSSFSAMPLQIFAWSDFPGDDFQHGVTPAAIVVLLVILLAINGAAIYIRHRFSKNRP